MMYMLDRRQPAHLFHLTHSDPDAPQAKASLHVWSWKQLELKQGARVL